MKAGKTNMDNDKMKKTLKLPVIKIGLDQVIDHYLVFSYGRDFINDPFVSTKSKIFLNVEYLKFQDLGFQGIP